MIVHVGFLSLIVVREGGLLAITSRAGRGAQGSACNIGRLSDDHSIIAISWRAGHSGLGTVSHGVIRSHSVEAFIPSECEQMTDAHV